MPKRRRQFTQANILKILPMLSIAGSVLCTFIGGLIGWSVWISKNVPQTSYVEELFAKNIKYVDTHEERLVKYIDEKILNVRKEFFDHSDFNKSTMESEYKGLSAKIDMLILIVQQRQMQKP